MLTYHREGPVGVVMIESIPDHLAQLVQLCGAMEDLCSRLQGEEQTRVIVLTGSGDQFFSTEKNLLDEFAALAKGDSIQKYALANLVAGLELPVIAAVNGQALDQGLELLLACDLGIAQENSIFGFSHLASGLIPWDGGTQRLPRRVGRSRAMEMLLTGRSFDASEALAIGLINKIVPQKELMAEGMRLAQEIASKAPVALRYAKEAVQKGMDMTLEQGMRLEADLYFLLHTTQDRRAGIKAFQEKKKPRFEGK